MINIFAKKTKMDSTKEDFADELLKRARRALAENTLLDAAGTLEDKISLFSSSPLDQSMIHEASEYLRPLLSDLEHCSIISNREHMKIVPELKHKTIQALSTVINRLNSQFNNIYNRMDCVFFFSRAEAGQKSSIYRKELNEVVELYQALVSGLGPGGADFVDKGIDKKLVKYSAVLAELDPIKNELNSLLNKYSKNAFNSRAELVQTKDRVSSVKKDSDQVIKKHKPCQILQYHTPFDFKEHISLAEEFLSELESLNKEDGLDYGVINKYKRDVLLHVSTVGKILSGLESMVTMQSYKNFSSQEIAAALSNDCPDKPCQTPPNHSQAGLAWIKTDSAFEKKYPMFLGSVHKMLEEAYQLIESKKELLKARITASLIEEFNPLHLSYEQLKNQDPPGLDAAEAGGLLRNDGLAPVCEALAGTLTERSGGRPLRGLTAGSDEPCSSRAGANPCRRQNFATTPVADKEFEEYASSLGLRAAAMRVLNEKFIAAGNKEYSEKCGTSITELEKKAAALAEAKKTYEKIADDIKQMNDSISSVEQLKSEQSESDDSKTKQPEAKQPETEKSATSSRAISNEQQLVILRDALSKKYDPEAYSAFERNNLLRNAINSYSITAKEYRTLVDSLAHSTIFSIDDSVKDIKGEQAAKIDRAIDQLEILEDSKSLPQKISEKIAELKEIKEEVHDYGHVGHVCAGSVYPLGIGYDKNNNKNNKNSNKILFFPVQQQSEPSLELSDYLSVANEPGNKDIKEIVRTLKGFTSELSWNDVFKNTANAVRALELSTSTHDISYLKGLSFALASSTHNGSIRTSIKYNGLSERLVLGLINSIQNYVDSSELKRAAVFS